MADVARTALRTAGLDDEENMNGFSRDEKDEVMLLDHERSLGRIPNEEALLIIRQKMKRC